MRATISGSIQSECERTLIRYLALFLCLVFSFVNFFPAPDLYAQIQKGVLEAHDSHSQTADRNITDPRAGLSLPSELGTIEEINAGAPLVGAPTIILIQDAHAIPEAQKSIRKIIEFLHVRYGIDLVTLEGAAGKIDSTFLRNFPDKPRLEQAIDAYLSRGELSGAFAASILDSNEAAYFGIEDQKLYEEGISAFLEALRQRPGLESILEKEKGRLDALKEKIYSRSLLEIDHALNAFYEDPKGFLDLLIQLSRIKAPDPDSELGILFQEIKGVPPAGFEREVKNVVAIMRQMGPGPTLAPLEAVYQDYLTSRIDAEDFALSLKSVIDEYHFPITFSKSLLKRISLRQRLKHLQGPKLFKEFEAYTQSVKESLFRSEQERQLDQESRKLYLLRKLVKLELTREEWEEFKTVASRQSLVASKSANTSEKLKVPGAAKLGAWHPLGLGGLTPFIRFYQNAEARERAMAGNLVKILPNQRGSVVGADPRVCPPDHGRTHGCAPTMESIIFVAGGFHTEGIQRLLAAQDISYAVISPAMPQIPKETHYLDYMRGSVSWKNYFEVKNGRIDLYEAFSKATRDALIQHRFDTRLLKPWRDELIRSLYKQGRIVEAKRYTRFIDEAAKGREGEGANGRAGEEWQRKINQFIDGLRGLYQSKQLTTENVLKLAEPFKQTGAISYSQILTWTAVPHGSVPAAWIQDARSVPPFKKVLSSKARSEIRSEEIDIALNNLLRLFGKESKPSIDELRKSIIGHNIDDALRKALEIPVTIQINPEVFLKGFPKNLQPRGMPWQIVYTYANDFEALLAIHGNKETPETILSMGPVHYVKTEAFEDSNQKVSSMLRLVPLIARTIDDNHQGVSFLSGGFARIIARPQVIKRHVIERWEKSLAHAGILEKKFTPYPFDIHKEWKINGVGPVATLLALMRHPYIHKKYFSGQPPQTVRVSFFGFGSAASEVAQVILQDYPDVGVRFSGINNSKTELYTTGPELPRGLIREINQLILAGKPVDLAGLGQSYKKRHRDLVYSSNENPLTRGDSFAKTRADILILASHAHAFGEDDVIKFQKAGGKIVVAATPNVATPSALRAMKDRGILFVPYTTSNIGAAYEGRQEYLRRVTGKSKYDTRIHMVDGITGRTLANIWGLLNRWQEENQKKDGKSFFELVDEGNQEFASQTDQLTAKAYELTKDLADTAKGGSVSEEAIAKMRERTSPLGQLTEKIIHNMENGMPYLVALRSAVFDHIYSSMITPAEVEQLKIDIKAVGHTHRIRRRVAAYLLGQASHLPNKQKEIMSLLAQALSDEYYRVRAEAAKALGHLGNQDAILLLIDAYVNFKEADPKVRAWLTWSLDRLESFWPEEAKKAWEIKIDETKREIDLLQTKISDLVQAHSDEMDQGETARATQNEYFQLGELMYRLTTIYRLRGMEDPDSKKRYEKAIQYLKQSQGAGGYLPLGAELAIAEMHTSLGYLDEAKRYYLEMIRLRGMQALHQGSNRLTGRTGWSLAPFRFFFQKSLTEFLLFKDFEEDVAEMLAAEIYDYLSANIFRGGWAASFYYLVLFFAETGSSIPWLPPAISGVFKTERVRLMEEDLVFTERQNFYGMKPPAALRELAKAEDEILADFRDSNHWRHLAENEKIDERQGFVEILLLLSVGIYEHFPALERKITEYLNTSHVTPLRSLLHSEQERHLEKLFEETGISRSEVRTPDKDARFRKLIHDILEKDPNNLLLHPSLAKLHTQFYQAFLDDVESGRAAELIEADLSDNASPKKARWREATPEEKIRSKFIRRIEPSKRRDFFRTQVDWGKGYHQADERGLLKTPLGYQHHPKWDLFQNAHIFLRLLIALELEENLGPIQKPVLLSTARNVQEYKNLSIAAFRHEASTEKKTEGPDYKVPFLPELHLEVADLLDTWVLLFAGVRPLISNDQIAGKIFDLEWIEYVAPEFAVGENQTPVRQVMQPPSLRLHWKEPLEDPAVSTREGLNRSTKRYSIESALLRSKLLNPAQSNAVPDLVYEADEIRQYAFQKGASREERFIKLEGLLKVALEGRLLLRTRYQFLDDEGIRQFANLMGRSDTERNAFYEAEKFDVSYLRRLLSIPMPPFLSENEKAVVLKKFRQAKDKPLRVERIRQQLQIETSREDWERRVELLAEDELIDQFYFPLLVLFSLWDGENKKWVIATKDRTRNFDPPLSVVVHTLALTADALRENLDSFGENSLAKRHFLAALNLALFKALHLDQKETFKRSSDPSATANQVRNAFAEFIKTHFSQGEDLPSFFRHAIETMAATPSTKEAPVAPSIQALEERAWELMLSPEEKKAEALSKVLEELRPAYQAAEEFLRTNPIGNLFKVSLQSPEKFQRDIEPIRRWIENPSAMSQSMANFESLWMLRALLEEDKVADIPQAKEQLQSLLGVLPSEKAEALRVWAEGRIQKIEEKERERQQAEIDRETRSREAIEFSLKEARENIDAGKLDEAAGILTHLKSTPHPLVTSSMERIRALEEEIARKKIEEQFAAAEKAVAEERLTDAQNTYRQLLALPPDVAALFTEREETLRKSIAALQVNQAQKRKAAEATARENAKAAGEVARKLLAGVQQLVEHKNLGNAEEELGRVLPQISAELQQGRLKGWIETLRANIQKWKKTQAQPTLPAAEPIAQPLLGPVITEALPDRAVSGSVIPVPKPRPATPAPAPTVPAAPSARISDEEKQAAIDIRNRAQELGIWDGLYHELRGFINTLAKGEALSRTKEKKFRQGAGALVISPALDDRNNLLREIQQLAGVTDRRSEVRGPAESSGPAAVPQRKLRGELQQNTGSMSPAAVPQRQLRGELRQNEILQAQNLRVLILVEKVAPLIRFTKWKELRQWRKRGIQAQTPTSPIARAEVRSKRPSEGGTQLLGRPEIGPERRAIIFGTGRVARAHLAEIWIRQNGGDVIFVSRRPEMVVLINNTRAYQVKPVGGVPSKIEHVNALYAGDPEQLAAYAAHADWIFTAVGTESLLELAAPLRTMIEARAVSPRRDQPFNIIFAENFSIGQHHLREFKKEILRGMEDPELKNFTETKVGFVGAVVQPDIPDQLPDPSQPLDIVREGGNYELILDAQSYRGPPENLNAIQGFLPVDDIDNHRAKKFLIYNLGHAILAYLADEQGFAYLAEGIQDPKIREVVHQAMEESAEALPAAYPIWSENELKKYVEESLSRFGNVELKDTVQRVARDPLRKLRQTDRLLRAAQIARTSKSNPDYQPRAINLGIAAAIRYAIRHGQMTQETLEEILRHIRQLGLVILWGNTLLTLDVGGTSVRLAILQGEVGEVLMEQSSPVNQESREGIVSQLVELISEGFKKMSGQKQKLNRVVIAFPARFSKVGEKTVIVDRRTNLVGDWYHYSLPEEIAKQLKEQGVDLEKEGVDLRFVSDDQAAAEGELLPEGTIIQKGLGGKKVLALTLGTGVGGILIAQNKVYLPNPYVGWVEDIIPARQGLPEILSGIYGDASRQTFLNLLSGTALGEWARRYAEHKWELEKKLYFVKSPQDFGKISGLSVTHTLIEGNNEEKEVAGQLLEGIGRNLALAVISLATGNAVARENIKRYPSEVIAENLKEFQGIEAVIFGGGLSKDQAGAIIEKAANETLEQHGYSSVKVYRSVLEGRAGILGAIGLNRAEVRTDDPYATKPDSSILKDPTLLRFSTDLDLRMAEIAERQPQPQLEALKQVMREIEEQVMAAKTAPGRRVNSSDIHYFLHGVSIPLLGYLTSLADKRFPELAPAEKVSLGIAFKNFTNRLYRYRLYKDATEILTSYIKIFKDENNVYLLSKLIQIYDSYAIHEFSNKGNGVASDQLHAKVVKYFVRLLPIADISLLNLKMMHYVTLSVYRSTALARSQDPAAIEAEESLNELAQTISQLWQDSKENIPAAMKPYFANMIQAVGWFKLHKNLREEATTLARFALELDFKNGPAQRLLSELSPVKPERSELRYQIVPAVRALAARKDTLAPFKELVEAIERNGFPIVLDAFAAEAAEPKYANLFRRSGRAEPERIEDFLARNPNYNQMLEAFIRTQIEKTRIKSLEFLKSNPNTSLNFAFAFPVTASNETAREGLLAYIRMVASLTKDQNYGSRVKGNIGILVRVSELARPAIKEFLKEAERTGVAKRIEIKAEGAAATAVGLNQYMEESPNALVYGLNEMGLGETLLGEIKRVYRARIADSNLTLEGIFPVTLALTRWLSKETGQVTPALLQKAPEILPGVVENRGNGSGLTITVRALELVYQDYRSTELVSQMA